MEAQFIECLQLALSRLVHQYKLLFEFCQSPVIQVRKVLTRVSVGNPRRAERNEPIRL